MSFLGLEYTSLKMKKHLPLILIWPFFPSIWVQSGWGEDGVGG